MTTRKLLESVRLGGDATRVMRESVQLTETFKGPRGGEYEDAALTIPVKRATNAGHHDAIAAEHRAKISDPAVRNAKGNSRVLKNASPADQAHWRAATDHDMAAITHRDRGVHPSAMKSYQDWADRAHASSVEASKT